MADKKILFQLEIEGADVSVRTIAELRDAIKQTNAELSKTEIGSEEYRKLERQLGVLKNTQKDVTDSARIAQRALEASATSGETTYRALNAQLTNARALYKELTEEERRGEIGATLRADISKLDAELKDIDASIGQFQRNVGNYAGGIKDAFAQIAPSINAAIPGFEQLNASSVLVREGIGQIGQTASATGKLLVGAFVGLQVVGAILDGVQAVQDFKREINDLRGQLASLTGASGEALDNATAGIEALKNTFGVGGEETIQTVNALQSAFDGLSADAAVSLIEEGFLSGANAGGELLDVLKEYPRLFEQMGFSAEEFISIQAKAGQEGIFSDKGVDAIKEFGIRIREQSVATKTSLEEAFGAQFTGNLFKGINDGSITVRDALVQVSTKLKETELPAKQLQQVISDTFGGPGEDAGDVFLKSLSDIDKGFSDTNDAADEYTARLREQLEAERELAAAKVEVVAKLNDLTGGTETLGQQIETFGIKTFGRFLDALRPVIDAFGRAKDRVVEFLQNIGLLSKEVEGTGGALDFLGGVFDLIASAIVVAVEAGSRFIDFIGRVVKQLPLVSSAFSAVSKSVSFLVDLVGNFPAYFAGVVESVKQAGRNIAGFFESLVIDAQVAFLELKKLNPLGESNDLLNAQIAALKNKQAQVKAAGRTIAEAFKTGFDSVPKPTLSTTSPTGPKETDKKTDNQGGGAKPTDRQATEAEAKKTAEAQKSALDQQQKYADQRVELLNAMNRRLTEDGIAAINNQYERQIAQERDGFERLKVEVEKQTQQLAAKQAETRKRLVDSFGAKSTQVQDFDTQAAADMEAQREAARLVIEQNEANHLERIAQIRKDAADNETRKELERIQAQIKARQDALTTAAVQAQTSLDEQINAVLNDSSLTESDKKEAVVRLKFEADKNQIKAEAKAVSDQIQLIETRLDELANSDAVESASVEEFALLSGQLDDLNAKRAESERAYTELVQGESDRRKGIRFDEINSALDTTAQIAAAIDGFQRAAVESEINALNEQAEVRQQNIAGLEDQLKGATGVQKQQLEARLKIEQDALKKIEAERAKVEKEEAKRQKAFAIIQAIINTAQAVSKTLATLGIPAGVPAAALAAALGAAQIAIIAAQPAAKGGLMGGVPEQNDGLVVMAPNISEMKNGDNVLATLRRGEVVLNKRQQAALGGAPTFRAIQVPGFAEGGAAGAIIAPPDVTGTSASERVRLLEHISGQLDVAIEATNQRIDRIRTFVVSEDVAKDLAEGAAIQTRATLGE